MDPEYPDNVNMSIVDITNDDGELTPDEVAAMIPDIEDFSMQSGDKMAEDSTADNANATATSTPPPSTQPNQGAIVVTPASVENVPPSPRHTRGRVGVPPLPPTPLNFGRREQAPSATVEESPTLATTISPQSHTTTQSHHGLPSIPVAQDEYRPPNTRLTLPTPMPVHTQAQIDATFAESQRLMAQMMADTGVPTESIPRDNANGEGSSGSSHRNTGYGHNEDEDNAWMFEEAEEDDREVQLNKIFAQLKERQKRIGFLSAEDKIEYHRAESQLLMLNRLKNGRMANSKRAARAREESEDEPDTMFIPETKRGQNDNAPRRRPRSPQDQHMTDDGNDDDPQFSAPPPRSNRAAAARMNDDENLVHMLGQIVHNGEIDGVGQPDAGYGFKKNGEPRKRRAPHSKNAREVLDKRKEKERERDRKKAQKQREKAEKAKAKGKGRAKKGKEAAKGKGKAKEVKNGASLLRGGNSGWGRSGQDELSHQFLQSIAMNDDIQNRLNNPIYDVGEGPEIHGQQTHKSQFAQLFAAVPTGSNKAGIREDKRQLKQAAQAFGYGKVKAHDGKWRLRGMSSELYHHQLIGARWMVERELSQQAPYGGILADSMGESSCSIVRCCC